jgi:uncharacterized protein YyaL (SSP411 family)
MMIALKNELVNSQNPYLLQHKDNPVAWRMWGDEPFEEARQRNIPVLVSIGYSTCHWCHVMAHEVFEDEETAAIMNENLICIKVDREEHPEVDEIYMEACQAMNGSGGWPLNVFVDHDRKPFFAATYVPRENWKNLVKNVHIAWTQNRQEVVSYANQLANALQEDLTAEPHEKGDIKEHLFHFLLENYDEQHPDFSGNGRAPRFPSHTLYYYLLSLRQIPAEVSSKLEHVLEAIQDSGLHDRVGGGFHRYSTDREWRVPHFEKMLYDNAQLMIAFTMASSRYNRPDFLQTAERIAAYLKRDMSMYENGQFTGFASAEDADDHGGEGSFYAWTPDQLREVLGDAEGKSLSDLWNITASNANVHGVYTFRIPHPRGSETFRNLSSEDKMKFRQEWIAHYDKLMERRQSRPRPFKDDKVVTETNALSLLSFSILYAHTLKSDYLIIINDLAKVLLSRFSNGLLQRVPGKSGHITDYGHSSLAFFTAWEATGNKEYLEVAINLVKSSFEKFVEQNGKVNTSYGNTFMKIEEKYDHAQPAGTHSLLLAWTRIYSIGRLTEYKSIVETIIARKQKIVNQIPVMVSSLLLAMNELENGPVTLSLPINFKEMAPELLKWVGTEVRLMPEDQSNNYQLCEKDRCLLPVTSPQALNLKYCWV